MAWRCRFLTPTPTCVERHRREMTGDDALVDFHTGVDHHISRRPSASRNRQLLRVDDLLENDAWLASFLISAPTGAAAGHLDLHDLLLGRAEVHEVLFVGLVELAEGRIVGAGKRRGELLSRWAWSWKALSQFPSLRGVNTSRRWRLGKFEDAGVARLVFQISHIIQLLLDGSLDEVVAEVDLGRRQCPGCGHEAEVAPHD